MYELFCFLQQKEVNRHMNSCKYNEISKLFSTQKRERKKPDTYWDRLAMLFFYHSVLSTMICKPLRQTVLK